MDCLFNASMISYVTGNDAEGLHQNDKSSSSGNDTSAGINNIMQQIANQADSVRRSFESSLKRNSPSPATLAAAQQMISGNKKRKLDGSFQPSATSSQRLSKTWSKARHFHSPIASLTRPDKKNEMSVTPWDATDTVPSAVRISDGIILNSSPNEIHVTYNDVVCGRGKMTNKLVGNQRYRVWIDLHRQAFAKAPLEEDRRKIAHSIVNTVQGSYPKGRFISLDIHSGVWYDVGYEKAVMITMDSLSDGVVKSTEFAAFSVPRAPVRGLVQRTFTSKAA